MTPPTCVCVCVCVLNGCQVWHHHPPHHVDARLPGVAANLLILLMGLGAPPPLLFSSSLQPGNHPNGVARLLCLSDGQRLFIYCPNPTHHVTELTVNNGTGSERRLIRANLFPLMFSSAIQTDLKISWSWFWMTCGGATKPWTWPQQTFVSLYKLVHDRQPSFVGTKGVGSKAALEREH